MSQADDVAIIDGESPSIQTHLNILQGIIQRMSANSSASKAWCVTLASAVLVIVTNKVKSSHVYIALFPILIFYALDAYYLALEKGFRDEYNKFIIKIHKNKLKESDLYSIIPKGSALKFQIESLKSFSVWGFYFSMAVLVITMKFIAVN